MERAESSKQRAAQQGIARMLWAISSFRHEVGDSCLLLSYYVVSSGDFLPTFWDRKFVPKH